MEKFNVTLSVKNYKAIASLEEEIEGDVFLISGDNQTGKTSLMHLLQEAWMLKAISTEPLSRGEDNGYVKVTIPQMDGTPITIVHDFNTNNPQGVFYAIKPDGSIVNNLPTIRRLIGDYAPITVEQFFSDMKYAESRRKLVKTFLLPLMGDGAQEIEVINKQINEGGSLYKERTSVNSKIKVLETQLQTFKVTPEEELMLDKYEASVNAIKTLEDALVSNDTSHIEEFRRGSLIFSEQLKVYYNAYFTEDANLKVQHLVAGSIAFVEDVRTKFSNLLANLDKLSDETNRELIKTREDLNRGKEFLSSLEVTKQKSISYESKFTELQQANTEKDQLEKQIEELKKRRNVLLSQSSLPAGIQTDGENITLDGFDFTSEQVSLSEAMLTIAEIMAQLFDGKIIAMGPIAEFGKKNRARLFELAKKYQKFVVLTKVTEDQNVNIKAIVE